MDAKKRKAGSWSNARRWTPDETEAFAEVLAEPENNFALSLEQLALKKSSNNEIYDLIRERFLSILETDEFKENNSRNFKRGTKKPTNLDLSIGKLRTKFKALKQEWGKKTTRVKNGSGLPPGDEPGWYKILNPIFAETNEAIKLTSSAFDTSFVNPNDSESFEEEEKRDSEDDAIPDDIEEEEGAQVEEAAPRKTKRKIVVAPHKKTKQLRSNKQALGEIARVLHASIAAQDKRFEQQLRASEEKERRMVEFREREAEKDRAQEYKMAHLYMSGPRFQHPPMDYSMNYCGATSGQFPFGSPPRPVSSSGQNMMENSSTVIRGANQHQSIGSPPACTQ